MSEEIQSDDVVRFHLTFSLDRGRFFRRTCPSCGRDFKTQADEADLATLLQPAFQRLVSILGQQTTL